MSAHKRRGWIGVDLDGTLLTYDKWVGWNVFGEPIPPMAERVRSWSREGTVVKIVTARVGLPLWNGERFVTNHELTRKCRVTGELFSDVMMTLAIQKYLIHHDLPPLSVQCYKDVDMLELWDDRAVQVVPNTGRTLAEEHEAELSALRGRSFQSPIVPVCDCEHPTATIADNRGVRCVACGKMAKSRFIEDHPSHNVSDSLFTCYGCGLPVGHPDLQKPCPTPDEVGKMRMGRK